MTSPTISKVRPRFLEWAVLIVLVPPVCWFACYVLLGIVMRPVEGDGAALAAVARLALWIAIPGSLLLVGWSAWRMGQRAYWRLDEQGLTQGRWRPAHYAWSEIEALFEGLPDEMSGVGATMARVPMAATAMAVGHIRSWRQSALVLRLTGRRLLLLGLGGKQFVGGPAFRAAVQARLTSQTLKHDHYTAEERRALAAHFVTSQLLHF